MPRAGSRTADSQALAGGRQAIRIAGILLPLWLIVAPASAQWTGYGSLWSESGRDSNRLVDIERDGAFRSQPASFVRYGGAICLSRVGLATAMDRVDLSATGTGARLGGGRPGTANSKFASLRYEMPLAPLRLATRLSLSRERVGRVPVLDQDCAGALAQLLWRAKGPMGSGLWFLRCEVEQTRRDYCTRVSVVDSTLVVHDRSTNVRVAARHGLPCDADIEFLVGHESGRSNDPWSEFGGPECLLTLTCRNPRRIRWSLEAAVGRRGYDHYVERVQRDGEWEDTDHHRQDDIRRLTVRMEYEAAPRSTVILEWSACRLESNLAGLDYDQSTASIKVQLHLWGPGQERLSLPFLRKPPAGLEALEGRDAIAPDSMGLAEVCFRYRDPLAQSVSVIGDFNYWGEHEICLSRRPGDGTWEVSVALPPGPHRYRFIVDGRAVTPRGARFYEPDGYGGYDAALRVPGRPNTAESLVSGETLSGCSAE